MSALPPIGGAASLSAASPTNKVADNKVGGSEGSTFEKILTQAVDDQKASDTAISDLVSGKNDNVQQVVMQVVKSEMSFQLFMEVRNQLVESYNELMRMQF